MIKSDKIPFTINLPMHKFDKACEMAYDTALYKLRIDEDGHCEDERFPRSSSGIFVQFVDVIHSGSMSGQSINYNFLTWMECVEDED